MRHNYGTGEFFKNATKGPGKALKMERVTLDGEERGYRLTTNEVNFEFGFAIRNVETGPTTAGVTPSRRARRGTARWRR